MPLSGIVNIKVKRVGLVAWDIAVRDIQTRTLEKLYSSNYRLDSLDKVSQRG